MSAQSPIGRAALIARLERLELVEEIRRLNVEFMQAFDRRDVDRFLSVWGTEATWVVAGEMKVGLDEIRATTESLWQLIEASTHWVSNIDVRAGEEVTAATIECHSIALMSSKWRQFAATYEDVYVRTDAGLRIGLRCNVINAAFPLGGPQP